MKRKKKPKITSKRRKMYGQTQSMRRKGKAKRRRASVPLKGLSRKAYLAGRRLSASLPTEERLIYINRHWARWIQPKMKRISWPRYWRTVKHYVRGVNSKGPVIRRDTMLIPTSKQVAVIISVMNEEKTLPGLLLQLNRLPIEQKLAVINGSKDNSLQAAKQHKATVIHYADPLGHDVGRAVGAKAVDADILLFLDGDFIVSAESLIPFIAEIETGGDIALNNLNPWLGRFHRWDLVTMWKLFLNIVMGRSDLGSNSMTAVPHALSRKAVELIGYDQLMVPPKAQSVALEQGLVVTAPYAVNVFSKNKKRTQNIGRNNFMSQLISGDHLEALKDLMERRSDPRLNFKDTMRNREAAGREIHEFN
jgi:hypothetical protein